MKRLIAPLAFTLSTVVLLGAGCMNSQTPTNTNTADTSNNEPVDTIYTEDDSIEVVTADEYGKDLDLVERYPDSLRSYYSSNEYETDVTYQTKASMDDVRSFYDEKLTADGWTNSEQATDYMEYVKGDEVNPEIITLYLTDYASQGIVEYELVYEPALTDEQIQDISDTSATDIEL